MGLVHHGFDRVPATHSPCRPNHPAESREIARGMVEITVTLRSGRVESWSQSQTQ